MALHLINSLRYQAALPVFLGFRLTDMGSLALEQPGSSDTAGSVVWLEYFAFAVPFFMAGLWLPDIIKKHGLSLDYSQLRDRWKTGRSYWSPSLYWPGSRNTFQLLLRISLVAGGFLLVFNDFVSGYTVGLHADPAGRVWRISVALYAVALILFLLALPSLSSPVWLKKLSRASFLVYLLHPIWIDATRFLHPWYQTQVVIPLSWLTALALHELALSVPSVGRFLGEGDRIGSGKALPLEERAADSKEYKREIK